MSRFSLMGSGALLALTLAAPMPSALAAAASPDFSGAWQSNNDRRFDPVPGSPTGPVEDDPAHPHQSRGVNAQGRDVGSTPSVGNFRNPNLTAWAADAVKQAGDDALAHKADATAEATCRAAGVPGILNFSEPIFFAQTPDRVTILYQRGPNVRRVYMNQAHTAHLTPSWYGESIGHYENDALIIDTIGFNDKSVLDVYRTPHSEALHVVERYRIVDGGKTMTVELTVDDPKSFKQSFKETTKYRRLNQAALDESICAENNRDLFTGQLFPIPIAATPDF